MNRGPYHSSIPYRYLVTLHTQDGTLVDHRIASAKANLAKVLPGQEGQTRRVYQLMSARTVRPRRETCRMTPRNQKDSLLSRESLLVERSRENSGR